MAAVLPRRDTDRPGGGVPPSRTQQQQAADAYTHTVEKKPCKSYQRMYVDLAAPQRQRRSGSHPHTPFLLRASAARPLPVCCYSWSLPLLNPRARACRVCIELLPPQGSRFVALFVRPKAARYNSPEVQRPWRPNGCAKLDRQSAGPEFGVDHNHSLLRE